jgi:hypothetical protein
MVQRVRFGRKGALKATAFRMATREEEKEFVVFSCRFPQEDPRESIPWRVIYTSPEIDLITFTYKRPEIFILVAVDLQLRWRPTR